MIHEDHYGGIQNKPTVTHGIKAWINSRFHHIEMGKTPDIIDASEAHQQHGGAIKSSRIIEHIQKQAAYKTHQ